MSTFSVSHAFCGWVNWGPEKLSNLPKVTQKVSELDLNLWWCASKGQMISAVPQFYFFPEKQERSWGHHLWWIHAVGSLNSVYICIKESFWKNISKALQSTAQYFTIICPQMHWEPCIHSTWFKRDHGIGLSLFLRILISSPHFAPFSTMFFSRLWPWARIRW